MGVPSMRVSLCAVIVLAVGCTPPETPEEPAPEPDTAPVVDTQDTGTLDTGTTDTAPPQPTFDCGDVPPPPFSQRKFGILTEEDFDFDADGYLIHQNGSNDLMGIDQTGDSKIIAPQVALDPAGIQVLSSGLIAVAAPDTGNLKLYDPDTGGHVIVANGLSDVNGIEIGADDRIYFSEMVTNGRVSWVDPNTGERGVVLEGVYRPNGLALSPDEQTLYIAGGLSATDSYVLAIDRDGEGWDTPRIVLEATDDTFDAIEVDACGAVYTVGFSLGTVLRIFPDAALVEKIGKIDADGWSSFSSMRFGNGIGGWERDTLYITNRRDVYGLDVETPGRPHPSNPNP